MDELEDFIIQEPYSIIADDEEAIQKASRDNPQASDWYKDYYLGDFKDRVREHLRVQQNYRCAYCRRKIDESQATARIEHIVNKFSMIDSMYEPLNFCLSCELCNTKKGRKDTIKDMNSNSLPTDSASYIIINPYYDKYSDYIELLGGIFYKPKEDPEGRETNSEESKGAATIRICGLSRFELAAKRADDLIKEEADINIKTCLQLIEDEDIELVDNLDRFIKRISFSIKEFKMKNRMAR